MRFYVEVRCQVTGMAREQQEELFDALADATYELHDVIDADLGTNLRDGIVDFSMSVDAESSPDALAKALNAVRSAVHKTGGQTPGWENHFQDIQQIVRPDPADASIAPTK